MSRSGTPVTFLYLNNVHVASYLAQLQGGSATSEMLSQQATESRNVSLSENGLGGGASATEQSTAQLSLTVTDQSRFTSLLDLLQRDGFVYPIDMSAPDATIQREFAPVPAGSFVKLTGCQLGIPHYVQAERVWREEKGRITVQKVFFGSAHTDLELRAAQQAFRVRQHLQGFKNRPPFPPGLRSVKVPKGQARQATLEMNRLVRRVGPNPRVPLSSCKRGRIDPNIPDLLMPVSLGRLSSSEAALAGYVTLVGKVMLVVNGPYHLFARGTHDYYSDVASLQQWSGANLWTSGKWGRTDAGRWGRTEPGKWGRTDLNSDATVLGPGYVIQPIAIYK